MVHELIWSFHPVIKLSQVLGTFPLTVRFARFKISKRQYIYSWCLMVITLIHLISLPLYVVISNLSRFFRWLPSQDTFIMQQMSNLLLLNINSHINSKSVFLRMFNALLISLMGVSAFYVSIFKVIPNFPELLYRMDEADSLLFQRLRPENFWKLSITHRKFSKQLVTGFFVFGISTFLFYIISLLIQRGVSFILFWCLCLGYINLVALIVELQFSASVKMLQIRFKAISDIIKTYHNDDLQVWHRNKNKLWRIPKIYETSVFSINPRIFLTTRRMINLRQIPLETIESLHNYYRELSDLAQLLNKIYDWHLLISTSCCFSKLVLNMYFSILGYVVSTGSVRVNGFTGFIRTVIWSFLYFWRIFIPTLISTELADEVKEIRHSLALINNRFLENEAKEELLIFSKYVSNKRVEIDAFGLFTLNMNLLSSAVTFGATIVVILLQMVGYEAK